MRNDSREFKRDVKSTLDRWRSGALVGGYRVAASQPLGDYEQTVVRRLKRKRPLNALEVQRLAFTQPVEDCSNRFAGVCAEFPLSGLIFNAAGGVDALVETNAGE